MLDGIIRGLEPIVSAGGCRWRHDPASSGHGLRHGQPAGWLDSTGKCQQSEGRHHKSLTLVTVTKRSTSDNSLIS